MKVWKEESEKSKKLVLTSPSGTGGQAGADSSEGRAQPHTEEGLEGRTMETVYSAAAFVGQCQGPRVTLGQRDQSVVPAGYNEEHGQPRTHWHLGVHLSPWMTTITF